MAQAEGLVSTWEVSLDWEVTGCSNYSVTFNPNGSGPGGQEGLRTMVHHGLPAATRIICASQLPAEFFGPDLHIGADGRCCVSRAFQISLPTSSPGRLFKRLFPGPAPDPLNQIPSGIGLFKQLPR